MMKLFKPVLHSLAIFLGALAVMLFFHIFGVFKLVIAVCFGIVFWQLYRLSRLASFRPYEVVIGANFETLCEDFGLQWIEEKPRDSRTFTAITPFLFGLFDPSNERRYMIGIYFNLEVSCAKIGWKGTPGSTLADRPRFSLQPRLDGYHIEVEVEPEWWSSHKSEASPAIRDLPVEYGGTIHLGFLPYGYIPDHLRREYYDNFLYPFERKQRQWKATLSQLGWSVDEYNPGRIQHRYLNITCRLF